MLKLLILLIRRVCSDIATRLRRFTFLLEVEIALLIAMNEMEPLSERVVRTSPTGAA